MRRAGYKAEMIYTGQTGWMQGARYGFVFDSTLNDFISGEMEHAVVTCYEEVKPDIIFIEGQSSLRNPSGPAGAEWIVSAAANAVVLQHNPARKQYKDMEYYPAYIAQPKDEIALLKIYGAPTVAITVNTAKMTESGSPQRACGIYTRVGYTCRIAAGRRRRQPRTGFREADKSAGLTTAAPYNHELLA